MTVLEIEIGGDAERDTRVETLEAGDRFRWLGSTYTVTGVRRTGMLSANAPVLRRRSELLLVSTEQGREQLFPEGHFVAALCRR